MPTPPKKDESTQDFIGRCMGYMAANEKDRPRDQRAAICYSMARQAGRKVAKPK